MRRQLLVLATGLLLAPMACAGEDTQGGRSYRLGNECGRSDGGDWIILVCDDRFDDR